MPDWPRLRERAVTRLQSLPRRLRGVSGGAPRVEALTLRSSAGYRLSAVLHLPAGRGPHPAVLLCPGDLDPGAVFTRWTQPLNADELAAAGVAALRFDPAGRGESWGPEDAGGPEHQDDVLAALGALVSHPGIDAGRVGVVAISMGLVMASGALARPDRAPPVAFLLDWEGPSDREIITAGGRRMGPALGHRLDDDFYWAPREPLRHVGRMGCGYVRVQAARDHAQPGELRHARRMIEAAAAGRLPWFRLNEHPPGEVPEAPEWYAPGRLAANRVLMRWIRRLTS